MLFHKRGKLYFYRILLNGLVWFAFSINPPALAKCLMLPILAEL